MIEFYKEDDYDILLKVWEASVRSTHDFLSEEDIIFYRDILPSYLSGVTLYVIRNSKGEIVSFMGLSGSMLEMLFIHPSYQRMGLGKMLLNFAVRFKGVYKVDVNEQNKHAYHFYKQMGFEVTGREPIDSFNRAFPILHMKLRRE